MDLAVANHVLKPHHTNLFPPPTLKHSTPPYYIATLPHPSLPTPKALSHLQYFPRVSEACTPGLEHLGSAATAMPSRGTFGAKTPTSSERTSTGGLRFLGITGITAKKQVNLPDLSTKVSREKNTSLGRSVRVESVGGQFWLDITSVRATRV